MQLRGELPARAGPAWRGWRFGHEGLLYAPDLRRGFSAGDLRELHWLQQSAEWREARTRLTNEKRAASDIRQPV